YGNTPDAYMLVLFFEAEATEHNQAAREVLDPPRPAPFVNVALKASESSARGLQALIPELRVAYPAADFESLAPLFFVAQSRAPFVILEPTPGCAKALPGR